MAGPRTLPADLNSQIPQGEANADLAASVQSPELARIAMSEGATGGPSDSVSPEVTPMTPEEAQAYEQESAGQASALTPMTPEEALAYEQETGAGASGSPYPGAPAPSPSEKPLSQGLSILASVLSPMWAGRAAIEGAQKGEASLGSRMVSAVGKDATAQAKIFADQTGLATRVVGTGDSAKVEFQRPGEDWREVSPKFSKSLSAFVGSLADHVPDVVEGLASSVPAGVAGAAGFLGGFPAGPGVAVPVSLAASSAAGAAGAAGAALAREGVARFLGADPDKALGPQVATQAALGAVAPYAGAVLRKPLKWGAAKLIEKIEGSELGKAIKFSELQNDFEDFYRKLTGGHTMSRGEAGEAASDLGSKAEKFYGERLDAVWKMAAKERPTAKFQVPTLQGDIEKTMAHAGARIEPKPRFSDMEPLQLSVKYDQIKDKEARSIAEGLGEIWQDLKDNDGITVSGMKTLYERIQAKANFGSAVITPEMRTYRALYKSMQADRESVLASAIKDTPLAGTAATVFSDYHDNIEALKAVSKAFEKSPEKAAKAIFADVRTAKMAKEVLSNSADPEAAHSMAWPAIRAAELNTRYNVVRDPRTGIVDIAKFHKTIMKDPDMAEVLFDKEQLATMSRLGDLMSRTSWKGLLALPDSIQAGATAKGLAKTILTRGSPNYAVNELANIFGNNPEILKLVDQKGILKFAEAATTLQEQKFWLKSSRMVNRILDATHVNIDLNGVKTYSLPIEQAMVPVLLNAGVRPHDEPPHEQRAAMAQGYQTYLEHLDMKSQEAKALQVQAQQEQALAKVARPHMPSGHLSRGSSAGKGPNFSKLSHRAGMRLSRKR